MKLLICACAAVYGLVWAARHPCRTMRGVWVRRGVGVLCFALALFPVLFLARYAGVRQEEMYDFQKDSVREAYSARAFLREDAGFYSLESTMQYSGVWDGACGQYWEILRGAQLDAQRRHLLEAVEAGASGRDEYAALARQAGEELRRLAEESEYPENRALLEKWAN